MKESEAEMMKCKRKGCPQWGEGPTCYYHAKVDAGLLQEETSAAWLAQAFNDRPDQQAPEKDNAGRAVLSLEGLRDAGVEL